MKIFMQNAILLYCSFLFIESLTLPRLPFYFLSDWPPNPNPKKGKYVKGFLISNFLVPLYFVLEILLRLAALFFPNKMEGSKRTTTRFGHLHSSTKKSKKTKKPQKNKKKSYNVMMESFLSSNTSNRFKFIVTTTRGKNLLSLSQKWNYNSYL